MLFAETLPKSALILEKRMVTANRKMVLWMNHPTKHPRSPDEDDQYTCLEFTRGHYYSGTAKVSLINTATKHLINTINIQPDELDLPYLIQRDFYYIVPKIGKRKEGKPVLMNLKDYNNDGKAREFVLFDLSIGCGDLATTLIGYSEKQDKVIQYQRELKTDNDIYKEYWVDILFLHHPNKQGVWKYEIDYRGQAGALNKYEIRYDKKREIFYGTLNLYNGK
jgi:hypothetical protein